MKTSRFFLTFWMILFNFQNYTQAQENFELKSIRFIGNNTFSSKELMDKMLMVVPGKLQQLILRKKPYIYSEATLKSDIDRLVRFYQCEGFLHVNIQKTNLEINHKKKTVKLTIKITEDEPIRIRHLDFQLLADSTADRDKLEKIIYELQSSLALVHQKRFRDQSLQADQELLTRKLSDAGYPYVTIRPELTVMESERVVNINWIIESGPQCVFGVVAIKGNQLVPELLIHKQLAFDRGQIFQQKLIDKTQQQVFALGIFEIATVKALLTQQKENVIPIHIDIKEAPRLTTKFGVGYGREDNFRIFSDSRFSGFLGGVRRLNLYAKHSGLEPYHINLKLTQPAFITANSTFTLNPFIRKQQEPGFTVSRIGASTALIHQLTPYLSGSVTYIFEQVDLETGSIGYQQVNLRDINALYNKSSIILGINRDNSTPLFSPTQGVFSALTFKISGLDLNSDFHYTKLLLDLRRYQQFIGMVLACRLKLGGITSMDANGFVPVEDRFFAGGSASVRGWARAQLGPVDNENIPTGGNSLLEGSLEFRFPVIGFINGVVFGDVGNVWRCSYSYKLDELRYAAGVGLRFDTPIGPIRLDLARAVLEESKMQVHLSVGQAF